MGHVCWLQSLTVPHFEKEHDIISYLYNARKQFPLFFFTCESIFLQTKDSVSICTLAVLQ